MVCDLMGEAQCALVLAQVQCLKTLSLQFIVTCKENGKHLGLIASLCYPEFIGLPE